MYILGRHTCHIKGEPCVFYCPFTFPFMLNPKLKYRASCVDIAEQTHIQGEPLV